LNLARKIADQIVREIRDNGLRPGDTLLPENKMCETYDVSRTVIREALTRLSAAGVVETGNGRKPRVAAFDASQFADVLTRGLMINDITTAQIMEARRGVEGEAIRLATLRRSDEDLERIAANVAEMKKCTEDYQKFADLDFAFHLGIATATRNPVFVYMITALRNPIVDTIKTSFHHTNASKQWLGKVAQDHALIFKLIDEQKVEAAVMAMTNHLDQSLSAQNYWRLD
jgi:GntR family transcriptional repressor for pyruvate dehydrogenase complex